MKFTKKILTENLFLSSDGPKFFTKGKKQSVMISEDQLERLLNVVKQGVNIRELDDIIKETNSLIRHAILKENLNLSIGDYQTITEEWYTKDSNEGATYTKDSEDGATYTKDSEDGATYDREIEEQGQYDRNPGIAAAEGIETILNGIKKAYDMIKDSETRRKLANSMTKLGNFMTITADALASGRDQRAMKSSDSLRDPLPYPELETVTVDDEIEEIADGDYKLTKEESEEVEEGPKPDFLDLDGDGNKKESMKKASKDKLKKASKDKLKKESKENNEKLIQEDIQKMKQIINPITK